MPGSSRSVSPLTKPKYSQGSPFHAPFPINTALANSALPRPSVGSDISLLPSAVSPIARQASIVSATEFYGTYSSSASMRNPSISVPRTPRPSRSPIRHPLANTSESYSTWASPVHAPLQRSDTVTSMTTAITTSSFDSSPPTPEEEALSSALSAAAKRGNSHLSLEDRPAQKRCTARLMRKLHETIGLMGDADIETELARRLGEESEQKDQRENVGSSGWEGVVSWRNTSSVKDPSWWMDEEVFDESKRSIRWW